MLAPGHDVLVSRILVAMMVRYNRCVRIVSCPVRGDLDDSPRLAFLCLRGARAVSRSGSSHTRDVGTIP